MVVNHGDRKKCSIKKTKVPYLHWRGRQRTELMDKGWGEEEEGEMNRESGMEVYTLSYMKHRDNRNSMYESGDSTWAL